MYDDGPGKNKVNVDPTCKISHPSGCFGHRDAILNADVTFADVGFGPVKNGQMGFAAIMYSSDATPSASDAARMIFQSSRAAP